jgi:hypothetical protein
LRPDYCRDRKRCKNLRANASSDFAQKASFFEQCRTKFGQLYPDVGSLQYNSTKCRREIENSLSQSSCAPRKGCALKPFTLVPMFGIFERNLAWTFEHRQLLSICLQHDFTQAHPKRTVVIVFTRHRVPKLAFDIRQFFSLCWLNPYELHTRQRVFWPKTDHTL